MVVNRYLSGRRRRDASEVVLDDVEPLATSYVPDPALGITPGTVRGTASRALTSLRTGLAAPTLPKDSR